MSRVSSDLARIALVTNSPTAGGLSTMTRFLYRVLAGSDRYRPEIISLATAFDDPTSVLAKAPETWLRKPRTEIRQVEGLSYTHVGAHFPEFEFQRHRPRRPLSHLLQEYDLVQFVVGAPYWACVAKGLTKPVVLWTATTVRADRTSRVQQAPPVQRMWQLLMIHVQHLAEKQAVRWVDTVFALSDYTAATIRPWIETGEVPIAVCGVDTRLFQPTAHPQGDYILCVGRLSDPRKNIQLLLRAYAAVANRLEKLPSLYLVGDSPGAITGWLEELGISDRVNLLGRKSGEELASLYQHARFFVLSSDEEGLGIVILEAMASGIPVISTDCGGPATAISDGETGFLTPVRDVEALAQAIQRLATDEALCQKMGRTSRLVAEQRFSMSAAGQIFLNKYRELL